MVRRGPDAYRTEMKRWARAVLADGGDGRPRPDQPLAVWILFRLRGPLLALAGLGVIATIGYMIIEGYGWVDAVYMTVITLGTIGYGEIHPLGTGGRFFTVGVIMASFGTFVYAASVLTSVFTSGEALRHIHERKAKIMRDALRDHVIVVGFGRVGQAVVRSLREMDRQCVFSIRTPIMRPRSRRAERCTCAGTRPTRLIWSARASAEQQHLSRQ
jgi:hypothetical protein